MHPLFHFLMRWKCRSVFHKLALQALRGIDGQHKADWQSLFLWHIEPFLRGVDAPEREFRDFANHSFDAEEPWGTAPRLAAKWHDKTVSSLRSAAPAAAAREAGTCLRYASFSVLILHGHHREPGVSRRHLVAWWLTRHYEAIDSLAGPPAESISTESDWTGADLEGYLARRAVAARTDEPALLARLAGEAAGPAPPELDDELSRLLAAHLRSVQETLAALLGRTIAGADVSPRRYPARLAYWTALPAMPIFWAARRHAERSQRKSIERSARYWSDGTAPKGGLPADVDALRDAYAIAHGANPQAERRGIAMPLRPTDGIPLSIAAAPTRELDSFEPVTRLSPIGQATSIGGDLDSELEKRSLHTVADLLAADPDELGAALAPRATAGDVRQWQGEAALCCDIPMLLPVEAQLLAACGVSSRADLAELSPVELWELVTPVAESPDGARILGSAPAPGLDTITEWIDAAGLKAA